MTSPLRDNPRAKVAVVIPALNEADSIGPVLDALPHWIDETIVVDNGSTDRTADIAAAHGARVVRERRRGYGSACLAGLSALNEPGIVVFLDADLADDPEHMPRLIEPIFRGRAELVIGARAGGRAEPGALTRSQVFGNALACSLIGLIWRRRFTDLGPFRAVRADALHRLGMDDRGFGWTAQMQARAARLGMRTAEVGVPYRRRIGRSKISGTWSGAIRAGAKILYTIGREAIGHWLSHNVCRRDEKLIVFSRFPAAGQTKTRLTPALGPEGAAELQRRMTDHTLGWADELRRRRRAAVEVRFTGGGVSDMAKLFGTDRDYLPQGGGDLGRRLARAFRRSFEHGHRRVIAIGTDCPSVTADVLGRALGVLSEHDVVLGPASDGGYYLIGLRAAAGGIDPLFRGVAWGSDVVLAQTRDIAARLGLRVRLLEELDDVDRPEDLPIWERARVELAPPSRCGRLTVIVPTRDEEHHLPATLERIKEAEDVELIVVDGGSRDRTVRIAESYGACVLHSRPGRAAQMNAGAAAGGGDILLFCHADTLLPAQYDRLARAALHEPGAVAGAFELGIDSPMPSLRLIERLVNRRSRSFGMPYGDQAIFLRAGVFDAVGGFPDLPVMEDYELMRRLRRRGRIAIAPAAVRTSARYWRARGPWRTSAINRSVVIGYHLGLSPHRLAAWRRNAHQRAGPPHDDHASGG